MFRVTHAAPMPRADLLRRGAVATSSWDFLASALPALAAGDRDPELLALVAAHAIRLRLRTLALDAVAILPNDFADDPQVAALRDAARALRSDAVPAATRIATTRANLAALADAGAPLAAFLDDWARDAAHAQAFRAHDGNIALRDDPARPFDFRVFADARGAARAWRPAVDAAKDPTGEPPVLVAGFAAPFLVQRIIDATPPSSSGYSPRVWIAEPDPRRALDALSLADIRPFAGEPRIVWLLGPGACDRLLNDLRARFDRQLPERTTEDAGAAPRERDAIRAALDAARAEQLAEHDRLRATLDATGRSTSPRCFVVATSRYSTFVRHSADDLVEALRSVGAEASLLIEPDPHSKLASVGYLRAFAATGADAVILINYTRASLPSVIPASLPCVTWIQDSMPHLFDERADAALRPGDLVVGHVGDEMAARLAARGVRSLARAVPASERKFAPPPRPHARACEVAYASHQSEPPGAMRDRLLREAPAGTPRDLLAGALDRVHAFASEPLHALAANAIPAAVEEAAAAIGVPPPPAAATRDLTLRALVPYAERIFRHTMLEWAAAICARRGWRFALHGRGWDRHPTLRTHDAGPVEHGDALRDCYARAGVHLHGSIMTSMHQRVFECALAGGLPVCRATFADVYAGAGAALALVAQRLGETVPIEADRFRSLFAHRLDEYPELAAFDTFLRSVAPDIPAGRILWKLNAKPLPAPAATMALASPLVVFGDASTCFFRDAASLEDLLVRAIDDGEWRTTKARSLRGRVLETHSYTAFARNLLAACAQPAEVVAPAGAVQPTS